MQFLVESVVLSSIGGILGVLLALATSIVIGSVIGVPFVFNPGVVALGFLFSMTVGVVFGFIPARRAAHLVPIDALRHE